MRPVRSFALAALLMSGGAAAGGGYVAEIQAALADR